VERNPVNDKVLIFQLELMPEDVPLVAFGKPVYVVIRFPSELGIGDYRYPFPRASEMAEAPGAVYGFVLLPNDADSSGEMGPLQDEL
jgi:hypothetical protein